MGKREYIKARFYWQGMQREVQVGSIPIVLEIMKKMLAQGYLQDISVPKSGQMTWEQFIKRTNLVEGTKKIAALKFQEYIIRKLSAEDTHQFGKANLKKRINKKQAKATKPEKYEGEYIEKGKFDWYVQWRNN